jgi:ABC-type glutathione transport system ATPase component
LELGAGFNPEMTGVENVYFNGTVLGFSKHEMDAKLNDILSFADIGNFVNQPIKTYSSGMLVRLSFAAAINIDPDILVIDEALAVGDFFFRQKCYKKLGEFRERGVPIILASHAMTEVEQFCQKAIMLDQGNVVFAGSSSEAVKRYYLLDQQHGMQTSSMPSKLPLNIDRDERQLETYQNNDDNFFWPVPHAFYDISRASHVSNGWAKCTGVALCNAAGEPCRNFQQGEQASFFFEFELLENIEVPVGGLVIFNEKNITVHAKNTIEYGTKVPTQVSKGSKLRFRQDISLELEIGTYTFEVGLATINSVDFKICSSYLHQDLIPLCIRLCHIPTAGTFSIVYRIKGEPVQLLHHGLCNLPGHANVSIKRCATHETQI